MITAGDCFLAFTLRIITTKEDEMGDKGGKKDKDKSKKQQSAKQEQKSKGKAERNRPKGL